jgi:hypothetical protein
MLSWYALALNGVLASGVIRLKVNRKFLLDGKIYNCMSIDKHRELAIIWDYETSTRHLITLKTYYNKGEKIWLVTEVAKIFNRSSKNLLNWLKYDLDFPLKVLKYGESKNIHGPIRRHYLHKQDIIDIYEILIRRGRGSKTKNDFTDPYNLPTREQLLAILNDNDIYYVREGEDFIPVFRPEWR